MRRMQIVVAAVLLSAFSAHAELFVVKMNLRVKAVDPISGNLSNVTLTAADMVAACGEDPSEASLVLDSDDPGSIFVVDNETGDDLGCVFADDTTTDRICAINGYGTKFYCQAFFSMGDVDGAASAVGPIDKRIDSATGAVLRYNWTAKIQGNLDAAFFGIPSPSVSQPYLPFFGTFSSPKRFVLTGSPSCSSPTATTAAAIDVNENSATVVGSANPNGFVTQVHFDYGLTPAFGNSTPTQSIGNGTTTTNVTANLSPLLSSQTYFYRLVASSGCGTVNGTTMSFMTQTNTSATVSLGR